MLFTLPLRRASAHLTAMRILVVDDNVDSADMLALLVATLGHQAEAVYASDAAHRRAQELRPDAVILDLSMPGMDGYELARCLRMDPITCGARLIAVSGHVFPQHRAASSAAGIDAHVAKPITIEALVEALHGSPSTAAPDEQTV